jgi:hypothetical protein
LKPAFDLNYHEAGLYCHLVIHAGNISLPLQQFNFHLWHIYWLSLIDNPKPSIIYTYEDAFLKHDIILTLMPYIQEIFRSNLDRYPAFTD